MTYQMQMARPGGDRHTGRNAMPKDLTKAARVARKHGWTIKRTGSNHFQWLDPMGNIVATHGGTPGSNVAKLVLQALRKAGLPV